MIFFYMLAIYVGNSDCIILHRVLKADVELIEGTKKNQERSGQVSNNGLLFVACEE
jgi:hypothetical protein